MSRHFIMTLLKDIPKVKAGTQFRVIESEDRSDNPYWKFGLAGDRDYDKLPIEEQNELWKKFHCVKEVWYDDPDFVKFEPDIANAVQVRCPACNQIGMFTLSERRSYRLLDNQGTHHYLYEWLECAHCKHEVPMTKRYSIHF